MWSCESTKRRGRGTWLSTRLPTSRAILDVATDLVVTVRLACLGRDEQRPGSAGREPAGEELGGAPGEGHAEEDLQPAPDVTQFRRAPAEHGEDGAESERGAEEVRDRVHPLGEDVRTDARLVVEQRAFVR